MCRIDEQDFPIDPRQLTLEEWQNFKRRVTERAQQDRQQVLRAAAIALPRALLAGACYGGSLLARIAGKACSAYALRREWRAVVRALDDRMLRDIGLGRSGDRIRNLRQRSRERIALARISRHECQALFDRGEPRSHDAVGHSRRIERYPWHVCFTLDSGRIAHCREPDVIANKRRGTAVTKPPNFFWTLARRI